MWGTVTNNPGFTPFLWQISSSFVLVPTRAQPTLGSWPLFKAKAEFKSQQCSFFLFLFQVPLKFAETFTIPMKLKSFLFFPPTIRTETQRMEHVLRNGMNAENPRYCPRSECETSMAWAGFPLAGRRYQKHMGTLLILSTLKPLWQSLFLFLQ